MNISNKNTHNVKNTHASVRTISLRQLLYEPYVRIQYELVVNDVLDSLRCIVVVLNTFMDNKYILENGPWTCSK